MSRLHDLVTLNATHPNLKPLRFHLLGDDELGGGVGGWEAVARPRRSSTAEWVGREPWTLVLPLATDGVDSGGRRGWADISVEPKLRDLVALGQPTKKTGEPPILTTHGPIRVPSKRMRWVLTDIEWGTQIRNRRDHRVYQEFVVHLMEYVRGDVLRGPAAAARARKGL